MVNAENVLICIAVPLAISSFFIQGGARRLVFAFLAGMVVCIFSAYVAGFIQITSGLNAKDISIFLSPMVEESMKLLLVLLCIYVFEPSGKGIELLAVGVGAGFATFENYCVLLSSDTQQLTYMLIRGLAVGVMHIVTLVALAKGFLLLKSFKVFNFAGIAGILSISVTVHGLYNLLVSSPGVSSYIGYVMPMLCAVLLHMVNVARRG
ncbi:PrsW family glutamic-type intramembrane protease [Fibrobacter sp.]|uniref:PrsW family glutamic-type intramembrane protease n=1 Tax=Fibrobacter sp. TaxID=35828 RepID=UPI00388D024C